jgi:ankyrin repeat protein
MKRTILTLTIASLLATTAFADPIHDAADTGDLAGVQAELDKGVDVNVKGIDWGLTPLHSATYWGHKEVAELLIANGADVNAKDDDGWTPLDGAIYGDDAKIAALLRKHGGKSGAEDSILVAVQLLNTEAVKQHLAAGVDVNVKGSSGGTPLHFATTKAIAELLIANGADLNAKDKGGDTPLHDAAKEGQKEVAELLIAAGADVNAKNKYGTTPLHTAAVYGHKEVAELLIAKGADVNAKTNNGITPLDYAKGETADLIRKHQLMPRLVQHGRFAFSFDAKEGKVYEVQDSFDLLNWEVIKTYTGTGATVRFDEERDHDPPKWFYRVRVVE